MDSTRTRRELLQAAGASAGVLAGLDGLALGQRRQDRPNVVLIVIDTLRTDHVYGKRARTPNMDALARQGLRFSRCYPEAMPTVPARRSILTGRRVFPFTGWHPYPGLLGEPGWAPIAEPALTFTSVLRRAGYWTAYVTDNTSLGFSPPYGRFRHSFDRFVRRGGQIGGTAEGVSERELRHWLPPQLEDPLTRDRVRRYLANGKYEHDETRSFAARVFRDGARVLELAARRHRPFALVVDAFEPHEPWTPPRRYVDMYGDPDYRGPEPAKPYYAAVSRYLHGRQGAVLLERMRALYAAEVTMTDRWLGVFLDRLEELRLERETVVVFVSDHGFYLGDYGLTGKSSVVLHPSLIRVPLVVVDPRRRHAGRTSSYFASTHDVGPTILSMAGVPVPRGMDGVDLSRFFEGRRPPARPYAFGGYGNSFFVRTDRWAMFGTNGGGGFNLYDRRRDLAEERNVAGAHPGKAGELYGVVRRRAGRPLPSYRF
jgi:arylsulfatase A-like enzyme